MTKRVIKFSLGALGIVLIGFGVLYALSFFDPAHRQEQEMVQKVKEIQKQYQNDTYGGDTPEETLQLFVEALKKGDTDLASKYFVIDEQEDQRQKLERIKVKGFLDKMVRDVEKLDNKYTLREGDKNQFIFETYNDKKELVLQADLIRGTNGKWKIQSL